MDIVRQIGAVIREVQESERDGRSVQVVRASRTYRTSPEDVWDALTTPGRLARWFSPVSGELRPGGRYQIEGNAGGQITTCEPPRVLAVTWEYGGDTSWVEVRLSENADGTTLLRLEHMQVPEDHWKKFGAGATGVGWDLGLVGLDEYLSSGDPLDQAWPTSPEAKEFVRRSSEDWCRAAIAGGAEAAEARAAAARTSAFYTGEGDPAAEAAPHG